MRDPTLFPEGDVIDRSAPLPRLLTWRRSILAGAAAFLVLGTLNVLNPDALVARSNLARSVAVQGGAAAHISRIAGSYTGIMGLPLFETARLLRELSVRF